MAGERFDPAKADLLLAPDRKAMIDAEWVADLIEIKEGDTAADLGAGNGYFTLPLASRTKNDVYAVDVEPEMLGLLGVRAMDRGFENVGLLEATLEDIPLPDACVNGLVAAFVMHEVPDRVKAFAEMRRMMKPGGKGAIVEWKREEFTKGPPLHERLESDTLVREAHEADLTVSEIINLDHVYVILIRN
ncbi:class I SAM-dependent methyltransferase [Alteribacter keqinensis]|uniref:Class I SAM-dependent methyltransferase n=1 Tax=Alteribacter keqinensis TaxID=2483800 RepID=A0A3M7TP05_9BACI|nr:class I SAM-dependent methyltransferase [Alteribacter keqinensis]RNA66856.1 class I SAM-dependent methyltransferase [Alteribacter keqinensis]